MQFVLCEMQFSVIRKVIGVEVELDGLLVKTYALHEVLVGTNYLGLSLEIHVCAQKVKNMSKESRRDRSFF